MFGFSRGAYTVRSLAGMIYCSGLAERNHVTNAPQAYELYRNRDIRPRDEEAVQYRKQFGDRIPITLVGCFDTVGALGMPVIPLFKFLQPWLHSRYQFYDTTLNSCVQNALHAMAIDEIREVFDVTPMQKNPKVEGQRVIQKWFPGEHGCVGGGTKENSGLSDAALQWMIDSVGELGLSLEFDPSAIPTGINPDFQCEFKNEPGFFALAGIKYREVGTALEDLHESAVARLKQRRDYRPSNLRKIIRAMRQQAEAEVEPQQRENM
jgi:uncharacterized protein (DUF2235 family)